MTRLRLATFVLIGTLMWVVIIWVFIGVAQAQTAELQPMTVTIPIDDIQRGDPGELFLVATEPLPEGIDCAGTLKTNNNESQHPDTNIIMVSATTATIFDVEVASYEARALALRSGVFESNGMVDVYVQIGEDEVSSTGFDLVIDCGGTTTTTTVPPTTSTTGPTTDTTTPPTVTTSSSIPTGIPSGLGPVGDDGLSPLTTWLLIGVAFLFISGLAWAAIASTHKAHTNE